MKKIKFTVVCFCVLTMLFGCGGKEEIIKDFWTVTYEAIYSKATDNQYKEGNWNIGIQDESQIKDEKHPDLTIRQIFEDDKNLQRTVMYSFANKNQQKTISYIYKKNTIKEEKEVDETITIASTDETYKKYSITYTIQNFMNGNYVDGDEATGELIIDDNNEIVCDNMPILKEALDSWLNLINDFQKEFEVNYSAYEFVNLPELAKTLSIEDINEISEEVATTIKYYAEPRINAKGYSLVMFLEVEKDMSAATYGEYNVERKGNDSSLTGQLEKRTIDNCFNITGLNDPDISYAVYIEGDTAYLYEQSVSDQDILNDIQNQSASLAKNVLKTTNESYQ